MRPGWLFVLVGPLLILSGCNDCDRCDEMRHDSDSDQTVYHHRHHDDDDDDDDGVRVWRFPFVEIAIDPDDPRGVGVRVADDENGYEYVDLNVDWDD